MAGRAGSSRASLGLLCELSVVSLALLWGISGAFWGFSWPLWGSPLSISGLVWSFLRLSELLWASLGLSGLLWASLRFSWHLFAYLGIPAPLWVSLGLSWLLWASLGFSGPRLASLASVVSFPFLLHFSNALQGFSRVSPVTFLGPLERAARSRAERGSAQRIKLRFA